MGKKKKPKSKLETTKTIIELIATVVNIALAVYTVLKG